MQPQQNDIIFTIINDGEEIPVHTYRGEYRDLRALINDRCYVEDLDNAAASAAAAPAWWISTKEALTCGS